MGKEQMNAVYVAAERRGVERSPAGVKSCDAAQIDGAAAPVLSHRRLTCP